MRRSSFEEIKTANSDSSKDGLESKKKDSDSTFQKSKIMNPIRDDSAIDKMKKDEEDEVKLEITPVRKRQRTCHVSALSADERPVKEMFVSIKRKTITDILSMDKEDKSLVNYKKALLGDIDENALKKNEPPEVEIQKIEIVCEGRPGGPIVLDFMKKEDGKTLFDKTNEPYRILEDSVYFLRVHFKVNFNIVINLKYANIVRSDGLLKNIIDKHEELMGSFSPRKQVQVFSLGLEQAPSGFFVRGNYAGKAMFFDADGIVHMQYDYKFRITSKW